MEKEKYIKINGGLKFDGDCINGKRTKYVHGYDKVN